MSEVLQYYQALIDDEVTLFLSGLVLVFAFQLLVFRWVERSSVVTTSYFVTTTTLVGGPFIAATLAPPSQLLGIYDRPVVWTLLSFVATIVGIGCSGSPQHWSASGRIRRLRPPMGPRVFAMAVAEQQSPARANSGFDLLHMRMETLGLEPSEVRRIEATVFRDMEAACTNCECKNRCEQDLAYASAGMVNHDWETYCPNATVLNATSGLPWFESYRRAASLAEA